MIFIFIGGNTIFYTARRTSLKEKINKDQTVIFTLFNFS